MAIRVFSPSNPVTVLPVAAGGTSSATVSGANTNLDTVRRTDLMTGGKIKMSLFTTGGANGLAVLDSNGKVAASQIPDGAVGGGVTVSGPTTAYAGTSQTYTITNFDTFTTYTVSVSQGSYVRNNETITVTIPTNASGTLNLVVNGVTFGVSVLVSSIGTPSITAPTNGATSVTTTYTVMSSAFTTTPGGWTTHASTDWQIATDSGFTNLVQQRSADTVNKTSWTVSGLTAGTVYYVRVRYNGANGSVSAWSSTVMFTTAQPLQGNQQAKLVASDAAAGDLFGWSVAISGDGNTVIVGAYLDDDSASDQGSAYIFTRSGSSWTQQAKLVASDASGGDYFGMSVAISGDGNTVIVGACYDAVTASNQGSAYIYV